MSIESSVASPRRTVSRAFYTWFALVAALIVFTGFARTYYLKTVFGTPALTTLVHLHGVLMTLWFTLFVVQVRLVAGNRVDLHRKIGRVGAGLAGTIVCIGTLTRSE